MDWLSLVFPASYNVDTCLYHQLVSRTRTGDGVLGFHWPHGENWVHDLIRGGVQLLWDRRGLKPGWRGSGSRQGGNI